MALTLPPRSSRAPVLLVPALGAGMERHVDRRLLGVAAQLLEAVIGALLPRHFRIAGGDGGAHVVGDLVRQGGVGVDGPAAEIDGVAVAPEPREARRRKDDLAPAELAQRVELGRREIERLVPG